MRPLTAWSFSALTALVILAFCLVGLTDPRPMIEVRTLPLITHFGDLTSLSPPGQAFRCEQDGLHRIDVRLVCSQETRVTLHLRPDSQTAEVLREATISPELDPSGHAWSSFEFEPIKDSAGNIFHFSLVPAGESATNISPWVRFHGQTGVNDPWGDRFLEAGAAHRGDFLSAHAHFQAMAFPVESLSPAEGATKLTIFDSPTSTEPLRVATLKPPEEVHAGWAFFSFEPLSESRWRRYYFELQVPERCRLIGATGENGEGIPVYKTFHGGEVPDSPLLGMTRGAIQQPDRDLVFRAWCEDPPNAVFARLLERTGDKLWFAAILWCLATAICLRLFVFVDPQPKVTLKSTPSADETASASAPAD